MAKQVSIPDVAEEMFQSVLATPKRQRRLRSSTFWAKFKVKKRTQGLIEQVKDAISQRGLILNLDDSVFGTEDKDEWVILTYVEPQVNIKNEEEYDTKELLLPPNAWFVTMEQRVFESEREVEY